MTDLNQCTFTGRLGADPEVKSFQNGGRICNLRIAVSEAWKDKQSGERKERTEWISVTIQSDSLIGVAERFLRKGSRILVQGQWRTRKWTDQQGNDRYSTECVLPPMGSKLIMLDGPQGGGSQNDGPRHVNDRGNQWGGPETGSGGAWNEPDDLDDDVPFISPDFALERRVR
ncbi:single-stranded DNA-binding protein [Novosphingopyxis sp. YJ-S2-01]|uniref:single-stranded DNA-binding protein n=1 Tax=Novosphingopyxis sp. YJ-S2-01 TaxID=2794021 RepID=UPI0018DBC243|nr:single-stranded DNA-binding protein [Novosphingopyxis sp. YJ-S2-01]MBH9537490.1 single-stranded DNA-binding protein [Novosphingopyxis sp. YJ-S2-01]